MIATDKKLLAGGTYAKKQLFCKSRIVAWGHASRYRLGRRLVEPYAGRKYLDYGCGDGTFLTLVRDIFTDAIGADVDPQQTKDCVDRFAGQMSFTFLLTDDLADSQHTGAYELITCMEVLEHCTKEKLNEVLADLQRLISRDGVVIISVPVEIGPALIGKQLARMLAGWRGLGDYKYRETYTVRQLIKMVFAGKHTEITRPVYRADFAVDRPNSYHGHKGFNWRLLRARLQDRFIIEKSCFSPLGWLGGHLSSQAWFICRPK